VVKKTQNIAFGVVILHQLLVSHIQGCRKFRQTHSRRNVSRRGDFRYFTTYQSMKSVESELLLTCFLSAFLSKSIKDLS
jgi:hypothetical protein